MKENNGPARSAFSREAVARGRPGALMDFVLMLRVESEKSSVRRKSAVKNDEMSLLATKERFSYNKNARKKIVKN